MTIMTIVLLIEIAIIFLLLIYGRKPEHFLDRFREKDLADLSICQHQWGDWEEEPGAGYVRRCIICGETWVEVEEE